MANEIQEKDDKKNTELIRLLQSDRKSESNLLFVTNCGNSEWTLEETNCLLNLISDSDTFPQLKLESDIYAKLSKLMTINGYVKSQLSIKSICNVLKQKYKAADLSEVALKFSKPKMVIVNEEESKTVNYKNTKASKRNIWSHKETECVINVLEKYGMPNRTNLRKFCLLTVDHLKESGFSRNEEQAHIKIKHLKALYNQVIRKTLKEEEFPFFSRFKSIIHAQGRVMKLMESEDGCITEEEHPKYDMEVGLSSEFNEDDISTKKARQIWTNKEIRVLLKFIEENNIITGKQLRRMISKAIKHFADYGFCRSPTQILIRWKNTKAVYWSTFRKKLLHPEMECTFFYQLHGILNRDDYTYKTKLDGEDNLTHTGEESITLYSEIIDNEDSATVIPSSPKRSRTGEISCASCGLLDSIDHYCVSLAHSMKRLDARKQAKLKIEIQQLMYKAEFDPDF
ncbi:hypothetical protein RI129_003446 [Pyrocoelia pectoralis]|uniref:BESS domain-containing protein n=1 Tax=Pyrocoelia pectoralis TaxID=417401 RepID=A0AAN7VR73_9COLE